MASLSVTDRVAIEQQEALFIRLIKAEAMAHMAMNADFLDYEPSIIHTYLWGLSDMLSEAKGLSERLLNALVKAVMRAIDTAMIESYWKIGRQIVEEEQQGAARADYGKEVLYQLSNRLSKEFGRGFGITTLEDIRKFYLVYQPAKKNKKSHALRGESLMPEFNPYLSWTHYRY